MATVASLPFFLFTLPAGVLADKVNRQKFVCAINLWLAAIAVGLAALGWLYLLNPYTILASVFLVGVGFAFNAPAWTSIVPQVVSDGELPSAATLSRLQLNISGIIGPVLGGFLVPLAGANFVFVVNAACFLLQPFDSRPLETPNRGDRACVGELFQIFRDGYPLRALRAGASSGLGSKFPVCSLYLSHSGVDAGHWLESVAPGFVPAWSFVHQYGRRLGVRSCVRNFLAQGSLLARFGHPLGQFADRPGLHVDGVCSPGRGVLRCRGACRRGMDTVCFGTL